MKKTILAICLAIFYSNIVVAEKVELDKKSGNNLISNIKEKTGSMLEKYKFNTDSKLFKTGKYSENK